MNIRKIIINHLDAPIGVGGEQVSFSWQIDSEDRNIKQKRYDLQLSLDNEFKTVIWHHNEWSEQSTNIQYKGPKLASRQTYHVRVKSLASTGQESDWGVTHFETGLLEAGDWQADWVTTKCPIVEQGKIKPFTGAYKFTIQQEVVKARIYLSALGIYFAELNQMKIGDDYFTPGWTDYNDRIQYQVYDITSQLQRQNEVQITVAEGWYSGYLGWEKKKDTYGNFNAFIAQIELTYADGSTEIIGSDETWQEYSNQWLFADLYNGEEQNLLLERKYNGHLRAISYSKKQLTNQENEPVRKQEELTPIDLFRDPSGRLVLDMGQNMVGWVRFTIKGEKNQVVRLIHGEVLDRDGNFYRGNIRDAQQTDTYTLDGSVQTIEPMFTFHGFRYVHLENFPEGIKKEDFSGVVLHSDMPKTGLFETSDAAINQLQHNILWGQKGNFLDVPTDCPQRDERLGWTADAQIFFPTASFNMDTYQFFYKWLKDLRFSQMKDGSVPFVVPDVLKGVFADNAARTTAAWGDAATIVPWEMYQRYGDRQILEESFDSMKAWVDYIRGQGPEEALWNTGLQLGDWLALDAEEGSFFGATDETLVATCYFAYSTRIVANTARILGKYQEYKIYDELYRTVKTKIGETYVTDNGLTSDTQTAHILILMFELYPEGQKLSIVNRLVELIEQKDRHLDTGFIGSPYICHVLSENGHLDLAYQLLFNKDLPSWLYQVEKGATTVWEHWDGIKNDGTFWDDGMNSFNHYAYGSIGNWMYETIAGIKVKAPGYQQSIIAPKLSQHLTHCNASLETMFGSLCSSWKRNEETYELTVVVPANTEAEIVLPSVADQENVRREISETWQPKRFGHRSGRTVVDIGIAKYVEHEAEYPSVQEGPNDLTVFVGSGTYHIRYELERKENK